MPSSAFPLREIHSLARDDWKDGRIEKRSRVRIACESWLLDHFLRSSNFKRNAYGDTRLIYTLWSSMVKSICSSGFSLSGSKLACIDATSVLSLSLSLGFPFRPTPAAGFRPSDSNRRRVPTIDASTARARAPRLFLLEHLAVIKRFRRRAKEKNEIETVSKLLS